MNSIISRNCSMGHAADPISGENITASCGQRRTTSCLPGRAGCLPPSRRSQFCNSACCDSRADESWCEREWVCVAQFILFSAAGRPASRGRNEEVFFALWFATSIYRFEITHSAGPSACTIMRLVYLSAVVLAERLDAPLSSARWICQRRDVSFPAQALKSLLFELLLFALWLICCFTWAWHPFIFLITSIFVHEQSFYLFLYSWKLSDSIMDFIC